VWSPDSSILYVAGDRDGRGGIVALEVATGAHRLVASDAVSTNLSVHPEGTNIYAPQPMRLDTRATDGAPTYLPSPAPLPDLPGTLVEVEAAARGWAVLIPDPA
jgi:hypothetical protein